MLPMQSAKIERFKARIDFDRVLSRERPTLIAAVVWPNMLKAPGLADGQWQIATDTTWQTTGGTARQWVLRRGPEQLAIVVFVSLNGPGPARSRSCVPTFLGGTRPAASGVAAAVPY